MDFKRLVAFFAISLAIFAGWEHFFPSPKPNPAQQAAQQQQQTAATAAAEAALAPATPITVTTDTVKAVIDEKKRRPASNDPAQIQSKWRRKQTLHPV